jgi:lysyl-tRNA synthetase class 2
MSKRSAGQKLLFYDLEGQGARLQLMALAAKHRPSLDAKLSAEDEFRFVHHDLLRRGDLVVVEGHPARTKSGELSIVPHSVRLAAPCLHQLPEPETFTNPESRQRKRHVDLLVNNRVKQTFAMRSKIIKFIRNFLDQRDFLEVETPVLCSMVGGANALPFVTRSEALDTSLFLRVAPELHLKQLVIGGLERVYEIGKCFRNEGIDATHNPEFTTCEFYMAWANHQDLLNLTETMLYDLVKEVAGSPKVIVDVAGRGEVEVDFTPPYRVISIPERLREAVHPLTLPDLNAHMSAPELLKICQELGAVVSPPHTTARLVDKLIGHLIEPDLGQPTFLVDHPHIMSPLAKHHPTKEGMTARFELFVAGKEICNAYSELNDPTEQRARFQAQAEARKLGDGEAQVADEPFCESLEYGLPPTAGWGIGIERLVMLLSRTHHIRDVQLFSVVKDRKSTTDTEKPRQDGLS